MRPRILFLDHTGALGGAELYLSDVVRPYKNRATVLLFENGPLVKRLQSEGLAVEVLHQHGGLQSVRKQSGLLGSLRALPDVYRLVIQVARCARRHDLIFSNSQKSLIVGALAGFLVNRPVVWNLHDMLTADHFSPVTRRIAVGCANALTDCIIVNSEATRKAFAESGGDVEKTHLVYNGIDPARFVPQSLSTAEKSLDIGVQIPNEAPLVGVFSRLAPWKGQHVLIEALTQLPAAHALLVGSALFDGDASYAERLRRQAHKLGVDGRIHFLGFRDDIPQLMHAVDVVLHTSVAPEPFGRVIVEGMLAGTPVVATRAGGAVEIIEEGQTGWLVPPGDPRALATTLSNLFANPDQAQSVAREAHAYAQHRFSLTRMHHDVERALRQILSDK